MPAPVIPKMLEWYYRQVREVQRMTSPYKIGDEVTYAGDLACDEAEHTGTVAGVEDDASGDQVVTVKFDGHPGCALAGDVPLMTQDILGSDLGPAR